MRRLLLPTVWWLAVVVALTCGSMLRADSLSNSGASVNWSVEGTLLTITSANTVTTNPAPLPLGRYYGQAYIERIADYEGAPVPGGLVWEISSYDGNDSVGPLGFSLVPNGFYRVTVRMLQNQSNGISEMQVAEFQAVVNTIRVAGTNTESLPIKIYVFAKGTDTIIGMVGANAGASYDETFDLPEGVTEVEFKIYLPAQFADGVWVEVEDPDSGTAFNGGSAAAGQTTDVNLPNGTKQRPAGASGFGGIVWNAATAGATTTAASILDKATFREGAGKIVEQLRNVEAASGGAAGSAAVQDKLDQVKAAVQSSTTQQAATTTQQAATNSKIDASNVKLDTIVNTGAATNTKLDDVVTSTTNTGTKVDTTNQKLGDISGVLEQIRINTGEARDALKLDPPIVEPDTTDLETAGEEKEWQVPVAANLFPTGESTPTFFESGIGTEKVLTVELPEVGFGSATWPAYTFTLDLDQYSFSVSLVRAVLSACVHLMFFLLFIKTGRNASAGA